jgi:hypothetical protein
LGMVSLLPCPPLSMSKSKGMEGEVQVLEAL